MTPRYKEISVSEVISRVKVQLRQLDTSNDSMLEMLIYEGLDSLDCSSQLVKKCSELEICDGVAKLPKDLVRFLGMRLPCDATTTINPTTGQTTSNNQFFIYADTDFLHNICDTTNMSAFPNFFQINKNFIHFNSTVSFDEVVIAYLGLNTDEFGNTMIYQQYERALMAYACYMFLLSFKDEATNYQIDQYRKTWVEQRNKIIGENRMREFEQDKIEIAALMLSRLITPSIYL